MFLRVQTPSPRVSSNYLSCRVPRGVTIYHPNNCPFATNTPPAWTRPPALASMRNYRQQQNRSAPRPPYPGLSLADAATRHST